MFCILDNDRMTVCSSSGINNSTEEAHWLIIMDAASLLRDPPAAPILEAPPHGMYM
jgi:hypothetical protein